MYSNDASWKHCTQTGPPGRSWSTSRARGTAWPPPRRPATTPCLRRTASASRSSAPDTETASRVASLATANSVRPQSSRKFDRWLRPTPLFCACRPPVTRRKVWSTGPLCQKQAGRGVVRQALCRDSLLRRVTARCSGAKLCSRQNKSKGDPQLGQRLHLRLRRFSAKEVISKFNVNMNLCKNSLQEKNLNTD